ncbi:MAG: hypothetical protein RIS94_1404 [Pseudomonadota bacterium]|jgi:hypothetical protein
MNRLPRYIPYAVVAVLFGAAGALVGHVLIPQAPPSESELHTVLHQQLSLDSDQQHRVEAIEREFAGRRQALENRLRADNAHLARAIQAEHGYGPQVAAAVDASHQAMGELQKATLEHVFAMRSVLRPDQATRYDAAVENALTQPRH